MTQLTGVLLIIAGLVTVFAKNVAWQLTQLGNSLHGRVSERTELWDAGATTGGLIALAGGVLILVLSLVPGINLQLR